MTDDQLALAFTIGISIFAILLIVGVPLLAVYRENSDIRASRKDFCLALLLYVLGQVAANIVSTMTGDGLAINIVAMVVFLIVATAMTWYLYTKSVQRARDIGCGKLICYLSIIPFLNIVTGGILLFKPSKVEGEQAVESKA